MGVAAAHQLLLGGDPVLLGHPPVPLLPADDRGGDRQRGRGERGDRAADLPGEPGRLLAAVHDLGAEVRHVRLRMRGELQHLPEQLLLEQVLSGIVLDGSGEDGALLGPRLPAVRVDQKQFLLHSDSAHVSRPSVHVTRSSRRSVRP